MTSTTASAADATPSWVYPPYRKDSGQNTATSNFGPVHLNDWMIIQWEPKEVELKINLVCFSAGGAATNNLVASNATTPLRLEFTRKQNSIDDQDEIYCHLWGPHSGAANTVVFKFDNDKNVAGPVTYSAAQASTLSSATAVASLSSATGSLSSTGAGITTSTASPSSSPSSSAEKSGLSTGAEAGIGVGVALAFIILAAIAGFFLLRRRKQKKMKSSSNGDYQYDPAPAYDDREKALSDSKGGMHDPAEMHSDTPAEMESGPVFRDPKRPPPNELGGGDSAAVELP